MADPLYVKRITTNLKTPGGLTVDMGPRVLIVGPNESGKSALAQSVLLATSGMTSGLLLRKGVVKSGDQIASMAPKGEKIEIRAELSNGDVAVYECEPGHKPKHNKLAALGISVDEVRDAFSGSGSTAKQFLVRSLVVVNTDLSEVRNDIKDTEIQSLFDEVIGDRKKLDGSGFIALMDSVEKTRKEYKTRAASSAAVLSALGPYAAKTNTEQMDLFWSNYSAATFAQWFRNQGKAVQAMPEEERPSALGPLRWLSKTLGGKDALAAAKPLNDARAELEYAISSRAMLDFAMVAKGTSEADAAMEAKYKKLHDCLDEYFQNYLCAIAIDTFIDRTNNYLPPGEKFILNRDTMYFGLLRNGVEHYALSGSTEARVLAAMCCALNGPGKLSIVVVDDRMWDGMTLAKTLKALEKAPCMVVMMSTMLPRGRARASWTFIELQGDEDETPSVPKGAAPAEVPDTAPSDAAEADGVSPESEDFDLDLL